MTSLRGKVVVVTGASAGLGRATVRAEPAGDAALNPLALARAAYGSALLIAPGPLLRAAGNADGGGTAVARVLGSRHLAQALATAGHPARVRLYAGAVVDALHATSMFALAAASADHRKPALVDAAVATTFCSLGVVAGRSAPGAGAAGDAGAGLGGR
ncbi:MAG: hypothetical protein M3Q23_18510 [Actinomycetota bacterium]|nr:hypothetical protein [Actinomycetota bacterium]